MGHARVLSVVLLVGALSSLALAGGPFGAPMSMLEPGEWAVDGAYWHEEMDLWGCGSFVETSAIWDPEDEVWEADPDFYTWDQKTRLTDFETDSYLASVEFGLCENWTLYARVGATSAEGDLPVTKYFYDEEKKDLVEADVRHNFDFGTNFSWQVGSAFTICRSGAWTWGGRMQFGMVDGGSDSFSQYLQGEPNDIGPGITGLFSNTVEAEIEWWQAVAYVGPTYQVSDVLSVYFGGGWQTLHATLDYEGTELYAVELADAEGPDVIPVDQYRYQGELKLKHASAIAVFGASWAATDSLNIGVDAMVGEAGKWGIGVVGTYVLR